MPEVEAVQELLHPEQVLRKAGTALSEGEQQFQLAAALLRAEVRDRFEKKLQQHFQGKADLDAGEAAVEPQEEDEPTCGKKQQAKVEPRDSFFRHFFHNRKMMGFRKASSWRKHGETTELVDEDVDDEHLLALLIVRRTSAQLAPYIIFYSSLCRTRGHGHHIAILLDNALCTSRMGQFLSVIVKMSSHPEERPLVLATVEAPAPALLAMFVEKPFKICQLGSGKEPVLCCWADLSIRDAEMMEVHKVLKGQAFGFSDVWHFCGSPEAERYTWDTMGYH
eukprot:s399_g9.t1